MRPFRCSFLPGSAVHTGLLLPPASASHLQRRLPRHWSTVNLWAWKELAHRLTECHVIVIGCPEADGFADLEERLAALAILPCVPPAVVYGRVTVRNIDVLQTIKKALPHSKIVVKDIEERRLGRLLIEMRGLPTLDYLASLSDGRFRHAPILQTGLRRVLLQQPMSEGQALLALESGKFPFIRKVNHLAQELGCSESFLRQEARQEGIRLDYTIRLITLLHGLFLYERKVCPWTVVAPRIGFKAGSNLTQFFERVSDKSPTEASRLSVHKWGSIVEDALVASGR